MFSTRAAAGGFCAGPVGAVGGCGALAGFAAALGTLAALALFAAAGAWVAAGVFTLAAFFAVLTGGFGAVGCTAGAFSATGAVSGLVGALGVDADSAPGVALGLSARAPAGVSGADELQACTPISSNAGMISDAAFMAREPTGPTGQSESVNHAFSAFFPGEWVFWQAVIGLLGLQPLPESCTK